jgi:arylsulfatase A-like enzyme
MKNPDMNKTSLIIAGKVMTGRHLNAFGMDGNQEGPLPLGEITPADRLRDAGDATGMVGQWHLSPEKNRLFPDGDDVPDKMYDPGNRCFEEPWNGPMLNYHDTLDDHTVARGSYPAAKISNRRCRRHGPLPGTRLDRNRTLETIQAMKKTTCLLAAALVAMPFLPSEVSATRPAGSDS